MVFGIEGWKIGRLEGWEAGRLDTNMTPLTGYV
jgi:hypothetical protein